MGVALKGSRPRIGVDLHSLEGLHQGSRTHCLEIFSRLFKALPEMDFRFFVDTRRWNAAELNALFTGANAEVVHMPHRHSILRLLLQFPGLISRHKLDILHTQYICPPYSTAQQFVSMHDNLFEEFPQFFGRIMVFRSKILYRRSARKAARLFTVSEYARDAISKRYGVPANTITTIYNAADTKKFHPGTDGREEVEALGLVPGSYVLTVGRLEPRKNHAGILKAFARLHEPGPKLVIVGQRDFGFEPVFALSRSLGLQDQVVFAEDANDHLLCMIYRHAKVLLYPTFAEGFGMPVVEAMASGIPVITSKTTSLPEVAGAAAILVDPHSVEEIGAALEVVLNDSVTAAEMIAKGFEQVKLFDWNCSVATMKDTYREFFNLQDEGNNKL